LRRLESILDQNGATRSIWLGVRTKPKVREKNQMVEELMKLLPTVIGGLIALCGSFGATWFSKHLELKHQSKQLAKAIKGELQGIAHIVTFRGYSIAMRNMVIQMEHLQRPILFAVTIEQDYTQIYKNNNAKIGSLQGDLPTEIAIVYTQISSLLDDFAYMNECSLKYGEGAMFSPNLDEMIRRLTATAQLLDDTIAKANQVCQDIDRLYK
jgi:hypothetical protein